jgi:hypothetical protein
MNEHRVNPWGKRSESRAIETRDYTPRRNGGRKHVSARTEDWRKYYLANRDAKLIAAKARQRAKKGLHGPPNPPKMRLADKLAAYRQNSGEKVVEKLINTEV